MSAISEPGGGSGPRVDTDSGLERGTNWWGAFVIGLAGTILVTGIAPFAVQVLGAASVPCSSSSPAWG